MFTCREVAVVFIMMLVALFGIWLFSDFKAIDIVYLVVLLVYYLRFKVVRNAKEF